MSQTPYSPFKIIHHPDKIAALREGEQIVPAQVSIIPSALCNHDCGFCAYRMSGYSSNQLFTSGAELASFGTNNPNRMMPFEKAMETIADCAEMGVKAIQITGGGEPTVHPHILEIFQSIAAHGMEAAMVTNGALLRSELRLALTRASWCRISIDAGRQSTYSEIRRVSPSVWDRVWQNIEALVEDKRREGSSLEIGVSFVVTKENWDEVTLCAKRARDAGVDNFRCCAMFGTEEERYFTEFYENAAAECREAQKLATPEFRVYNSFGDRVADLAQHSPDYSFCGYQQFHAYIADDLNVYRCCVLAYNERGLIGSIKEQSFRQLWESEQKRLAIQNFDARGCPRCAFNSRNRAILYAIDSEPVHVNFV
jgi:MoaA/NifB/PqqE/SkfB family radical SAM enzyme